MAGAASRIEGGDSRYQDLRPVSRVHFHKKLGGTATDFVLLVVNPRGADAILFSKVKLGGDGLGSEYG
jgi:hypothetical protein